MSNNTLQVKSSRIEDGIEICNTCVRPADSPYRYQTSKGETRGCIAKCHDKHVAVNTKPNWMAPRMVLPKWICEARRAIAAQPKISRWNSMEQI